MNQEKELDKLLKAALERRVADVPPLPSDFAERVLERHRASAVRKTSLRLLWAGGIAAALVVGFFLWPREQAQQPGPAAPTVVAELPKQPTDTPIEPEKPAPLNTPSTLKAPKTPSSQPKPSKPVVPEEPQVEPLLAEAEPTLPSSSGEGLGEGAVIPPEKQALVDILLAEEALQVAYKLQEPLEELRAFYANFDEEAPDTTIHIIAI